MYILDEVITMPCVTPDDEFLRQGPCLTYIWNMFIIYTRKSSQQVDAALDLSHTQNIGAMLRTHFSHSQFIVVSLKEVSLADMNAYLDGDDLINKHSTPPTRTYTHQGMFNNANVIFRTRFVDGVSTVTRTLGNGPALNSKQQQQNQ